MNDICVVTHLHWYCMCVLLVELSVGVSIRTAYSFWCEFIMYSLQLLSLGLMVVSHWQYSIEYLVIIIHPSPTGRCDKGICYHNSHKTSIVVVYQGCWLSSSVPCYYSLFWFTFPFLLNLGHICLPLTIVLLNNFLLFAFTHTIP